MIYIYDLFKMRHTFHILLSFWTFKHVERFHNEEKLILLSRNTTGIYSGHHGICHNIILYILFVIHSRLNIELFVAYLLHKRVLFCTCNIISTLHQKEKYKSIYSLTFINLLIWVLFFNANQGINITDISNLRSQFTFIISKFISAFKQQNHEDIFHCYIWN